MPDRFPAIRVYLDANILISATYSKLSRFHDFWRMRQVSPVVSAYALIEVRRNLLPHQEPPFYELLSKTQICADPDLPVLPAGITLVEKDRAILAAAIHARADFLITGDKRHFGHLYNRTVSGVRIVLPADFLDDNAYRLPL